MRGQAVFSGGDDVTESRRAILARGRGPADVLPTGTSRSAGSGDGSNRRPLTMERVIGTVAAAVLLLALTGVRQARSQDSSGPQMPEAARLALRAKSGDVVKVEEDQKVSTRIHLEAFQTEITTETHAKTTGTYTYRGHGANSTLLFDLHESGKATISQSLAKGTNTISIGLSGLYAVKPDLTVVKRTGFTSYAKGAHAAEASIDPGSIQVFGAARFPDRVLKPGDTWSGSVQVAGDPNLRGTTISYQASLAGFEMYQSFPCARVEVNYSYKGPLPGITAQIRKGLPKASQLSGSGDLSGSETIYYALDRGWPLSAQSRITVALNYSVTVNSQKVEFGGTIEAESRQSVTGYPPYEPSLVPKVAAGAQ